MWFWFWLVFVIALFALPLLYGWGYRGWGPPYPRRYRRARADPAASGRQAGWGWMADALWLVVVIALTWLVLAALL